MEIQWDQTTLQHLYLLPHDLLQLVHCESVVIGHLDGLVEFLLVNHFCSRRFHHGNYAVFAYRQLDLLGT